MMFATGGSSMSKGESLGDTLRILNKYQFDAYVIRTENAGAPWLFKRYTPSPIINAGDGAHEHPSQALLDAFTLLETWKEIKGKRICLLGDVIHSRVAGSNIRLLSRLGAKVILCGPGTLLPRKLPKEWEEHWGVEMEEKMEKAIEGVDAVMTWRLQKERMNKNLLTKIRPMIYPNDNCKKYQFPRYAMPGTEINVNTEVSVATIENIAIYHFVSLPAEK